MHLESRQLSVGRAQHATEEFGASEFMITVKNIQARKLLRKLLGALNASSLFPGQAHLIRSMSSLVSEPALPKVRLMHDRFQVRFHYLRLVEKMPEKDRDEHCEQFWQSCSQVHAILQDILQQNHPPRCFERVVHEFSRHLKDVFSGPWLKKVDRFCLWTEEMAMLTEEVKDCWATKWECDGLLMCQPGPEDNFYP